MRVGAEYRAGQPGVGQQTLGGDTGRSGQGETRLSGVFLHGGTGENVRRVSAFQQPPFGRKIRRHARMPLEVVFGEIGPEGGRRAQPLQGFRLKRTDFADSEFHPTGLLDDKTAERITDVPGGVRRMPGQNERMRQELGEGGLAIGAGDRDELAAPENRRKIQFAQADTARLARRGQPGMSRVEARTEHHQSVLMCVRGGELVFRIGRMLIIDPAHAADFRQQRQDTLAAHAPAKNGDGALQQHGDVRWGGREHKGKVGAR